MTLRHGSQIGDEQLHGPLAGGLIRRWPGSGAGLGCPARARAFDGASPAPDGPRVRYAGMAVAIAALVAIGTAESLVSVEQLAQLPGRGRPPLGAGGVGLSLGSVALSATVYLLLGLVFALVGSNPGESARAGAMTGLFAGLIGGFVRAVLVRDYLDEIVGRFGLPLDLVSWSLAVLVFFSAIGSAAGGAAITWLSFRGGRWRPTPRPPS